MRHRRSVSVSILVVCSLVSFRAHAGLMTSHSWEVTGTQANENFGNDAIVTCDVNHDGYPDVIVSADAFDGAATHTGKVFVYLGTPTGPSTTLSWSAEGDQSGDDFGISVA